MALSKKAKKRLWIGIGILIALPILLVLVVILRLGTVIHLGVERAGPMLLGVETRLDDADASLFRGKVSLSGLHVANPEGFSSDTFLEADEIRVGANILALRQNEIHIREIILDGPEITYEHTGKKSNIGVFLERLEGEETEEDDAEPDEPEEEGEARKLKVDLIRITDAKVHVVLLGKKVNLTLGSIELRNLADADGNGIPPKQILRAVLENILSQVKGVTELSDQLKGIGDDLKEAVEKNLEDGKEIGDSIKDAGEELEKAGKEFKKLFGK